MYLYRGAILRTERMGTEESGVEPSKVINLIAKRAELIAQLREGPKYNRDLQERLGVSRSTVYKAIRELKEHDIVEGTDRGNRLSLLGRLADREYQEFVGAVESICAPDDLLPFLPTDVDLDLDVLDGAAVIRSERHAPNRPVAAVEEMVERATSVVGISPVALPQYVAVFRDEIVAGRLTADLLLERPVVEHVVANYRRELEESFATGNVRIWQTAASLPFGLVVVEEPEPETAVLVYDADGTLQGVIHNTSRAAFEWGMAVYESYLQGATQVSVTGG